MEDHVNTDVDAIIKENPNDTDAGKETDIRYCDLCKVSFHQKYLENHLCSKKHRSKLKNNAAPPALALGRVYCPPCDEMFSNNSFYDTHKGSKTHRRNVKAQADQSSDASSVSAFFSGGPFSARAMKIDAQTLKDQVEEAVFVRKKYKTRPISEVDYRQQYICMVTTYLSLRLALDASVKDFNISTNDKRWHSFGDIVIDVTTNKDKYTVYAIKCKQVSETEKRIDNLSNAKVIMDKEYESLTSLKKIQEFPDARFLIFTTNSVSSTFSSTESETTVEVSGKTLSLWKTDKGAVPGSDILLVKPSKRTEIVDVTSDRENVFSIYPKLENESYSLPFVYLYTSQRVSPKMIDDLLRKKFDTFIFPRYFKYIENWMDGDLGGNYYLKKRDVILKIGELLLSPYVRLPKRIECRNENFDIWNKVIANVDLTVIKRQNHINSKICQPINQMIEKMFVKIDGLSKCIDITDDILKSLTEPAIRAYLFEEYTTDNKSEIPISTMYTILWKSGKIPLLLESEKNNEKNFILEVIYFMKQYGVNKKFITKTSQPVVDKRLRIFTCLEDVENIVDLEKVGFTINEYFLSLREIRSTDPFFLKWITPNIFFEMALGRYRIQKSKNSDEENYDDLKMILGDKTKENLLMNLYAESGSSWKRPENKGRLRGINPLWF